MGHINLMDGLSLLHQWTDNCVESGNLFFTDTQAAAGFRYGFLRFGVGMLCIVKVFQQGTFTDLFAAITDIRHPKSCRTDFLNEVWTVVIALLAEFAVYCRSPRAVLAAERFLSAVEAVPTGIVWKPWISGGKF